MEKVEVIIPLVVLPDIIDSCNIKLIMEMITTQSTKIFKALTFG